MIEDGLQELAPLLTGDIRQFDAVGEVVEVNVAGDNPTAGVNGLILLLRFGDEVRIRNVVRQLQSVFVKRLLAISKSEDGKFPSADLRWALQMCVR